MDSDIWTVRELTNYIRELFEIDFRLQDVNIEGEISNFTRARSGHLYFTLKDEKAQLKCVMWRTAAQRINFQPQEGDAVLVSGRIGVYETSGVYQLYADWLEPAGRGDLALAFERLKEQLAAEGLFDPERKQPIPPFPKRIGLVTSADAAALRDILTVLQRRCPLVEVLIAPTLVQGEQAPAQIVRSLQWLDGRYDIDTIIVARGGGSIEDLWAFNDEGVARALAAAQHPIISGVGHETDFTISDFVADLRAPTPSAAAELAVPDLSDLPLALKETQGRLSGLMGAITRRKQQQVQLQMQSLALLSPRRPLDNRLQQVDGFSRRLEQMMALQLAAASSRLAVAEAQLTAVSPLATLARGYAIVRDSNGRIVSRLKDITPGDDLDIQVSDGTISTHVTEIKPK